MNDSFRMAFGSIIREEWINIESEELCKPISENSPAYKGPENINLDEELLLEEILEKELLQEHGSSNKCLVNLKLFKFQR